MYSNNRSEQPAHGFDSQRAPMPPPSHMSNSASYPAAHYTQQQQWEALRYQQPYNPTDQRPMRPFGNQAWLSNQTYSYDGSGNNSYSHMLSAPPNDSPHSAAPPASVNYYSSSTFAAQQPPTGASYPIQQYRTLPRPGPPQQAVSHNYNPLQQHQLAPQEPRFERMPQPTYEIAPQRTRQMGSQPKMAVQARPILAHPQPTRPQTLKHALEEVDSDDHLAKKQKTRPDLYPQGSHPQTSQTYAGQAAAPHHFAQASPYQSGFVPNITSSAGASDRLTSSSGIQSSPDPTGAVTDRASTDMHNHSALSTSAAPKALSHIQPALATEHQASANTSKQPGATSASSVDTATPAIVPDKDTASIVQKQLKKKPQELLQALPPGSMSGAGIAPVAVTKKARKPRKTATTSAASAGSKRKAEDAEGDETTAKASAKKRKTAAKVASSVSKDEPIEVTKENALTVAKINPQTGQRYPPGTMINPMTGHPFGANNPLTGRSFETPAAHTLPNEIFERIFSFCPPKFLKKVAKSSLRFFDIINDTVMLHRRNLAYNYGPEMPGPPEDFGDIDVNDMPGETLQEKQRAANCKRARMYTDLLDGTGCMAKDCELSEALTEKPRRVYCPWLVRWCEKCFKKAIIKEDTILKGHQYPFYSRAALVKFLECIPHGCQDSWEKPHFLLGDGQDRLNGEYKVYKVYRKADLDAIIKKWKDMEPGPFVDDLTLTDAERQAKRGEWQNLVDTLDQRREDFLAEEKTKNEEYMVQVRLREAGIRYKMAKDKAVPQANREKRRELFMGIAATELPDIPAEFVKSCKPFKDATKVTRDGGTLRGFKTLKPKIVAAWELDKAERKKVAAAAAAPTSQPADQSAQSASQAPRSSAPLSQYDSYMSDGGLTRNSSQTSNASFAAPPTPSSQNCLPPVSALLGASVSMGLGSYPSYSSFPGYNSMGQGYNLDVCLCHELEHSTGELRICPKHRLRWDGPNGGASGHY